MSILETEPLKDEVAQTAVADCVRLAREGYVESFAELVRVFRPSILKRLRFVLGNLELADETAQEVFLAAWQSINQFDGRSNFEAWLFGIARNKANSVLRSEIARRNREQSELRKTMAQRRLQRLNDSDAEDYQHQIDLLNECKKKLNQDHRNLLERYYAGNETADAIAQDVGRSGSAIRMLLMRLRNTLHDCMKRSRHE